MQSSSKLFPVALVSAELRGDLTEDVYLLKPGNSPDGSVALALTRLGHAAAARATTAAKWPDAAASPNGVAAIGLQAYEAPTRLKGGG